MPSMKAFFTNMSAPMPLRRKLYLAFRNNFTKIRKRQSCCGHLRGTRLLRGGESNSWSRRGKAITVYRRIRGTVPPPLFIEDQVGR